MSYSADITLLTNTYSERSRRDYASVRSNASEPLSEPNLLTLSHETAKNGRVSSVVIFDDTKIVSLAGASLTTTDTVRTMFKVQYNPLGGRTDNEAAINAAIAELIAFLGVADNVSKLLNQET